MADLLALSRAAIDEGKGTDETGPLNRINHQLSEIGSGVAMVEAFSHCVLFETDDGLVAFDTSNESGGRKVVDAVRRWRPARKLKRSASGPTATRTIRSRRRPGSTRSSNGWVRRSGSSRSRLGRTIR